MPVSNIRLASLAGKVFFVVGRNVFRWEDVIRIGWNGEAVDVQTRSGGTQCSGPTQLDLDTFIAVSAAPQGTQTWFTGSGSPGNDLGTDGAYYLDNVSGQLYFKQNGVW